MAERHMRKSSTYLAIKELHNKTTLRYQLIHVRMAKIKTPMTVHVGEDVEKGEHFSNPGGSANMCSNFGKIMVTPQENQNESNTRSSISTPRNIPKRSTFMQQGHLLNDVHSSTVCNSQKLEAA